MCSFCGVTLPSVQFKSFSDPSCFPPSFGVFPFVHFSRLSRHSQFSILLLNKHISHCRISNLTERKSPFRSRLCSSKFERPVFQVYSQVFPATDCKTAKIDAGQHWIVGGNFPFPFPFPSLPQFFTQWMSNVVIRVVFYSTKKADKRPLPLALHSTRLAFLLLLTA